MGGCITPDDQLKILAIQKALESTTYDQMHSEAATYNEKVLYYYAVMKRAFERL